MESSDKRYEEINFHIDALRTRLKLEGKAIGVEELTSSHAELKVVDIATQRLRTVFLDIRNGIAEIDSTDF